MSTAGHPYLIISVAWSGCWAARRTDTDTPSSHHQIMRSAHTRALTYPCSHAGVAGE